MKRILRSVGSKSAGILAIVAFCLTAFSQGSLASDARFSETKIQITTKAATTEMIVEIAQSPDQLAQGLMYRKQLPENRGMLFDFGEEKKIYMWMKNTFIPLDMIFLNQKGVVVGIHPQATPFSEAIISIAVKSRFVLEVNAGVAAGLGLEVGDRINHAMFN